MQVLSATIFLPLWSRSFAPPLFIASLLFLPGNAGRFRPTPRSPSGPGARAEHPHRSPDPKPLRVSAAERRGLPLAALPLRVVFPVLVLYFFSFYFCAFFIFLLLFLGRLNSRRYLVLLHEACQDQSAPTYQ